MSILHRVCLMQLHKKISVLSKKIIQSKRNTLITKIMLNRKFLVHDGTKLKRVVISTPRLGTKLGEYSFTRKFPQHLKRKKKKK